MHVGVMAKGVIAGGVGGAFAVGVVTSASVPGAHHCMLGIYLTPQAAIEVGICCAISAVASLGPLALEVVVGRSQRVVVALRYFRRGGA